jgi:beta-N-acetylhexosaminidase
MTVQFSHTGDMTLEELIGQTMMVGFWETTPSPQIIELIQRHHVGSIILFSRNVHDAQQVLELTQRLQAIAREAEHRYPLLIAIDQENGIVQRLGDTATIFPGNMALGAIGSEDTVFEVARATGGELRAFGINLNLAPVMDVNNNPANPVIGVRSFGEDPHLVARLGSAMVRGYHAAGIISCLKHFPGHGDTTTDSHLALPIIPHTLERLEALELVPFDSGIQAGADCVMTAHIAFPAMTHQATLPATLSPAIIQGLLRQQLGFDGVVLSDCLEMQAISNTYGTERAAVMALQAGIDLVLVSHHYEQQRGSIEAILTAARAGQLAPQVIKQAAERVLSLKARYLSWDGLPNPSPVVGARFIAPSSPEAHHQQGAMNRAPTTGAASSDTTALRAHIGNETHLRLQQEAYARAITLVRNDDALLPLRLSPEQRLVVFSPPRSFATMVEDRYYRDDVLVDILRCYHANVSLLPIAPGEAIEQAIQSTGAADTFIVATVNAHLDEAQAAPVRALIASGRRVIVLAVRNPYDLQAFPGQRTCLATYEYTRPALEATAHVIFQTAAHVISQTP